LAARSWLVTFYHRDSGREDVLAGGLTEACAEELAQAIIDVLQAEESVPAAADDTPAAPAQQREATDIE